MTLHDHMIQKLLELAFRKVWKGLEKPAEVAALECCEPKLMGDSNQSSQYHNVDYNAAGKD